MAEKDGGAADHDPLPDTAEGVALSGLLSVDAESMARAWGEFASHMNTRPDLGWRLQMQYQAELARIWLSEGEDDGATDPRFANAAWRDDPMFSRLRQSYFAWTRTLDAWLEESGLTGIDRQRAAFLLETAKETFAPVNSPFTPETIERAIETRGDSLLRGLSNFMQDQVHNHGYPAIADRAAFTVGKDVAPTAGAVVYRDALFELIQYTPRTRKVQRRPLLYVFSQVNRFYLGDLTEDRSLFRQLLDGGIQVFAVSWRNPTASQAGWSLATYAEGVIRAIAVCRSIAGVKQVDLMGLCAGGLTAAAAAGLLRARRKRWIGSLSLFVSILDNQPGDSGFTLFVTDDTVAAQKRRVRAQGMMLERDVLEMFAMLRLDESVFSFVRSNYFRGEAPLSHPLLFWSMDYTRVPAEMQCDFIDLAHGNALARGEYRLAGQPIRLDRLDCPVYIMAGTTDHITPWHACYRSSHLFGGEVQFVLTNQNHTQTISARADNPHLKFWLGADNTFPHDPADWLASAAEHTGDWRVHWITWLRSHSKRKDAPVSPGNSLFPSLAPAPGRYVLER